MVETIRLALFSAALVMMLVQTAIAAGPEMPKTPEAGAAGKAAKGALKPKVSLYFWSPFLGATLRKDANSASGTNVNLGNDVGLESRKAVLGANATVNFLERHNVTVDFMNGGIAKQSYTGSKAISAPITFNGVRYPAGDNMGANLDVQTGAASYDYEFDKGKYGALGAKFMVRYFSISTRLSTTETPTNNFSDQVIIAALGGSLRNNWHKWLYTKLDIAIWPLSPAIYYDFSALADMSISKNFTASLGWKYIKLKSEPSGATTEITFNGPILMLTLKLGE
jgi:hypothetical protein